MEFKSVQFMTSNEKMLVYKQWERFIMMLTAGGGETVKDNYGNEMPILFKYFTDRIYKHLSLHASFIAHYDRWGFFSTYFANPEDTIRFINQFDKNYDYQSIEYGMEWVSGDYEDLNKEMCNVVEQHKSELYSKLRIQVKADKLAEIKILQQEVSCM